MMRPHSRKPSISILAMAAFAALSLVRAFAQSDAGPFEHLVGTWAGSGTIAMSNGTSERIRCRAKYSVSPSGLILHQLLRCASDSYTFNVRSDLVYQDSGVKGTWNEETRRVSGSVSGRVSDGKIAMTVAGTGFTATYVLAMRSDQQSVTIKPDGGDISAISVELRRAQG
ncbi:MAG: hypothetical protein JO163_00325 [Methylobacteriaceae bacterium]|nr:hypothetical protein [Methylobacteriaceae bacterium]MBV9636722.1 hypothetical protein [Methylobacteriaceae bacterium]MBV9701146.1 hypothetical protein [Methylobacteriaceae bacterium]